MNKYEIINPSDKYFIEADDLQIASLAVLILGEGFYGLKSMDGELLMPIFMFGGVDEWFEAKFGLSIEDSFRSANRETIAACLKSTNLPDGQERTSLNDIGSYARELANRLMPTPLIASS